MFHMHLTAYPQVAFSRGRGIQARIVPTALWFTRLPLSSEGHRWYTAYLQHKLVEWYAAAPKSDRRAPAGEEADEEAPEAGKGGEGGIRNRWPRCLTWIIKPLQPDFEAKEDRKTYGTSSSCI